MEQIKATIPTHLRNRIVESKTEHVPSTCAHLVAHLASNPIFPQLLQQLTDPEVTCCSKDADAALRWKMDGNSAVRCKDFEKALSCYSKVFTKFVCQLLLFALQNFHNLPCTQIWFN
ncbi:hypothetical protein O6H91_02G019900 [Diphasiastrum complanatum]|uniref:Uncharacterized protein n=1 Tax=Diphasiastrum complanatum TaxID=34168 RepID=A0ACC2EDJ5_DIPCM|nr:hypothetical protein O6H91_02G019900 [Diphasiastrum complanatum]